MLDLRGGGGGGGGGTYRNLIFVFWSLLTKSPAFIFWTKLFTILIDVVLYKDGSIVNTPDVSDI